MPLVLRLRVVKDFVAAFAQDFCARQILGEGKRPRSCLISGNRGVGKQTVAALIKKLFEAAGLDPQVRAVRSKKTAEITSIWTGEGSSSASSPDRSTLSDDSSFHRNAAAQSSAKPKVLIA